MLPSTATAATANSTATTPSSSSSNDSPHLIFLINIDTIPQQLENLSSGKKKNATTSESRKADDPTREIPVNDIEFYEKIELIVLKLLLFFYFHIDSRVSWSYHILSFSPAGSIQKIPCIKRWQSFTPTALKEFHTNLKKFIGTDHHPLQSSNKSSSNPSFHSHAIQFTFEHLIKSILGVPSTMTNLMSPSKSNHSSLDEKSRRVRNYLFVMSHFPHCQEQLSSFFQCTTSLSRDASSLTPTNTDAPDFFKTSVPLEQYISPIVFEEIDRLMIEDRTLFYEMKRRRMGLYCIDLTEYEYEDPVVLSTKIYMSKVMETMEGGFIPFGRICGNESAFIHLSHKIKSSNFSSPCDMESFRSLCHSDRLYWLQNTKELIKSASETETNDGNHNLTCFYDGEQFEIELEKDSGCLSDNDYWENVLCNQKQAKVNTSNALRSFGTLAGDIYEIHYLNLKNGQLFAKSLFNSNQSLEFIHDIEPEIHADRWLLAEVKYGTYCLVKLKYKDNPISSVKKDIVTSRCWFNNTLPTEVKKMIFRSNHSRTRKTVLDEAQLNEYTFKLWCANDTFQPKVTIEETIKKIPHEIDHEHENHKQSLESEDVKRKSAIVSLGLAMLNEKEMHSSDVVENMNVEKIWQDMISTYFSNVHSSTNENFQALVEEDLPAYYALLNHLQTRDSNFNAISTMLDMMGSRVLMSISELEQKYHSFSKFSDHFIQQYGDQKDNSTCISNPCSTLEFHQKSMLNALKELVGGVEMDLKNHRHDNFPNWLENQKQLMKLKETQLQIIFIFEAIRIHKETGEPLFNKNLIRDPTKKKSLSKAKKPTKKKSSIPKESTVNYGTIEHYTEALEEYMEMLVLWHSIADVSQESITADFNKKFVQDIILKYYNHVSPGLVESFSMKVGLSVDAPTPKRARRQNHKDFLSPFSRRFKRMKKNAEKDVTSNVAGKNEMAIRHLTSPSRSRLKMAIHERTKPLNVEPPSKKLEVLTKTREYSQPKLTSLRLKSQYERTMSLPDLRKARENNQLAAKLGGRKTIGSRSITPDPIGLEPEARSRNNADLVSASDLENPFLSTSTTQFSRHSTNGSRGLSGSNSSTTSILNKLPPSKVKALEKRMTRPFSDNSNKKRTAVPVEDSFKKPTFSLTTQQKENWQEKNRTSFTNSLLKAEESDVSSNPFRSFVSPSKPNLNRVIVAATPEHKSRAFDIERIAESPL